MVTRNAQASRVSHTLCYLAISLAYLCSSILTSTAVSTPSTSPKTSPTSRTSRGKRMSTAASSGVSRTRSSLVSFPRMRLSSVCRAGEVAWATPTQCAWSRLRLTWGTRMTSRHAGWGNQVARRFVVGTKVRVWKSSTIDIVHVDVQ